MKLRTFSTLQIALGISLSVHAALLTLRLADPEAFNRVFQDTPLEVILVNTRTNERPDQARAIAQASMAGGGDHDRGRASSPLPSALISIDGDGGDQELQQLRELQERQSLMLTQVKSALAALTSTDPQQVSPTPDSAEREQRRRQLVKMLAEIERRIQNENARPRKRYIGPSTREAAYAVYYDHLRRAIEDKGTDNFPTLNGHKLYGELTMVITVDHLGRVLSSDVLQSSGIPALDNRARAIARAAGPFGKFSPTMRRQAEQIAVVSRFTFTHSDTLETQVGNPSQ